MNKLRKIFQVKQLPVFQNVVYSTRDAAINCIKGDVVLVQNMDTGFIYNHVFNPSLMEYGTNYQNEQACSPYFKTHIDEVIKIIHKYFDGKSIIEIGCGKGYFLECLQKIGFSIMGFDPAYEGNNPHILKKTYNNVDEYASSGIILRHVLEHIPDPFSFLTNIKYTHKGEGIIYIEVPSFEWICLHRTWFDVYYEHVNYFTLRDFERMFGQIHESGFLFGGQYLYVVADLTSLRTPILENELVFEFPDDFLPDISNIVDLQPKIHKSVIWGGSSKGVIFALIMQRAGMIIDFVIDINPKKQNTFMPGSGLQVLSPDRGISILKPQDKIFVMNSNYLEEIKAQSENRFHYLLVENE